MIESEIDCKQILSDIRMSAIAIAQREWLELGALVSNTLPNPLNPMILLPVATGTAVGGKSIALIDVAAIILLADLSLRIIDDCADRDNHHALYTSIGVGRSINYAIALNTLVIRELFNLKIPTQKLASLTSGYFDSFLKVCQGQDQDIKTTVESLSEYEEIVKLKTLPAYEFAAFVGAQMVSKDRNLIELCSTCGVHLGWMTQILDDIESLWFPTTKNRLKEERMTFPILFALKIDHPTSKLLEEQNALQAYDRLRVCDLLDEMGVRTRLMNLALDHRDRAIMLLESCVNPIGSKILGLWLDWLWRDGESFLKAKAR
ncbi:MAG: polyprenyl synthetase family protein [Pseudanabaena sp. M046S1SP1A06QC]|jgi:geranylgeranyl pyrophosphate synthase|nr:polyprenyl synthetase family protein [Pseudanabaena sp. M046S1SP1A06QC]